MTLESFALIGISGTSPPNIGSSLSYAAWSRSTYFVISHSRKKERFLSPELLRNLNLSLFLLPR